MKLLFLKYKLIVLKFVNKILYKVADVVKKLFINLLM